MASKLTFKQFKASRVANIWRRINKTYRSKCGFYKTNNYFKGEIMIFKERTKA